LIEQIVSGKVVSIWYPKEKKEKNAREGKTERVRGQ